MKRFKFRLESTLSLRSFRKKQAARALVAATNRLGEIENDLRATKKRYSEAAGDLLPGPGQRVTGDALARRQSELAYYREAVKRISEQYQNALEVEASRRQEFMAARQEEESLLRLKAKAKEAYQVELIRSDEFAVQEFVTALKRDALI